MRIDRAIVIVSVGVAFAPGGPALAHPGHVHDRPVIRTWELAGGRELTGSFIAVRDGAVWLRDEHDREIVVRLDDLCNLDQMWVNHRLEEIRARNTVPLALLLVLAAPPPDSPAPAIARAFQPFAKKVKTSWD